MKQTYLENIERTLDSEVEKYPIDWYYPFLGLNQTRANKNKITKLYIYYCRAMWINYQRGN